MIEITVIVSDSEKKLSKKHLHYDPITISQDDPTLKSLVEELTSEFQADPEEIRIKISFQWS